MKETGENMIGKPEWFGYRFMGWGLGLRTWQSYVYILVASALIAGSIALAKEGIVGIWLPIILFAILIADVIHIMTQMTKAHDERENYHQLIIERNCSFAAIASLIGMALYETYKNTGFSNIGTHGLTSLPFDISIIVVLAAMVLTKFVSTIYVKSKM